MQSKDSIEDLASKAKVVACSKGRVWPRTLELFGDVEKTKVTWEVHERGPQLVGVASEDVIKAIAKKRFAMAAA